MKRVIVISSDAMGKGNDELGALIIGVFFNQLLETSPLPDAIIFYNTGVRLLDPDAPVSAALDSLFRKGVDLIACGTCVSYFKMGEGTGSGRVSNMQEIVSILMNADRVVTI